MKPFHRCFLLLLCSGSVGVCFWYALYLPNALHSLLPPRVVKQTDDVIQSHPNTTTTSPVRVGDTSSKGFNTQTSASINQISSGPVTQTISGPLNGSVTRVSSGSTSPTSSGPVSRVSSGSTIRTSSGPVSRVSSGSTIRTSSSPVIRVSSGSTIRTSSSSVTRVSSVPTIRTSSSPMNQTSQGHETQTISSLIKQTSPGPKTQTSYVPTTQTEAVVENKTVYLCVAFSGRLGNIMFKFASLLGTARLHGVTPAIPKDNELRKHFNINVAEMDAEVAWKFPHVGNKRDSAYDPIEANFNSNLTMTGFFQSWKYFSKVYPELRTQFTFKSDVMARASSALVTAIQSQHGKISFQNTTFVGVHIRRGDIVNADKVKFGYAVGSKEYLAKAMEYFVNIYQRIMFVVCSNDMKWSRSVISQTNATFITGQKAEVDMAILSLCNHTIVTVGSFGFWSAWLAGGTTIYQKQQVISGTPLAGIFSLTDYMLPEWIGIDQSP